MESNCKAAPPQNATPDGPPNFPKAILSTSREEYCEGGHRPPLELSVKVLADDGSYQPGELPEDLYGHVFIVGPVGAFDSPTVSPDTPHIVRPSRNGWTSLFNGDGKIYRIDFHQTPDPSQGEAGLQTAPGKAWLAARIAKPPCYYVDRALYQSWSGEGEDPYKHLRSSRFHTLGLARFSLLFGSRNYLNTALLAMPFPNGQERLLVTWDVGRPYEVDPYSLKLIAPVGANDRWEPLVTLGPLVGGIVPKTWPFPPRMSSAHPMFDPKTGEVFSVNVLKTLSTLIWPQRLFLYNAERISGLFSRPPFKQILMAILWLLSPILDPLLRLIGLEGGRDDLYLMRWDGCGAVDRWRVTYKGKPITIRQSTHQMGITEKYAIISDSSFKINLEDFLPKIGTQIGIPKNALTGFWSLPGIKQAIAQVERWLKKLIQKAETILRKYLSYPQLDETDVYIVSRADLKADTEVVSARRVKIPRATPHFIEDYCNPQGKDIVLHAALMNASDPAEFVRSIDNSVYKHDRSATREVREIAGMVCNPMDLNRIGYHYIDGALNNTIRSQPEAVGDDKLTWSVALYAYRDDRPTERFENVYWCSWGFWPNLFTDFIYQMYKDSKFRDASVQTIKESIGKMGIAANLFRVCIDYPSLEGQTPKMSIHPDRYYFPPGYFGNSPQFVPRKNSTGSTVGYIVCLVIHSDNLLSDSNDSQSRESDNTEIWIFDAENLSQGPKYKLSHPQLNIGITVHSTWLSAIAPPPPSGYNIREDYRAWLQDPGLDRHPRATKIKAELETLFENEVYPHFGKE